MTLDELRERFPALGFALYAITPAEPVVFEVHATEGVFTFTGSTAAAAIAAAFPEPVPAAEPAPDIFA